METTEQERKDTEAGALQIIQRLRVSGKHSVTLPIDKEIEDLQFMVSLIHDVNLLIIKGK